MKGDVTNRKIARNEIPCWGRAIKGICPLKRRVRCLIPIQHLFHGEFPYRIRLMSVAGCAKPSDLRAIEFLRAASVLSVYLVKPRDPFCVFPGRMA